MSTEFCSCDGNPMNTGVPGKQRAVSVGVQLIWVPMMADDGTLNQISVNDTIDQAYLDALINNPDPSKRWYPIGYFKENTDERADPATQTFTDGSSGVTTQGVRAYDGQLVAYSPTFISKLDSFKCTEGGVYTIDPCFNLTGSESSDGLYLNPIRVNGESWYADYIKASNAANAAVRLRFEFSQLEKDKTLKQILNSEVDADFSSIRGLRDVTAAISNISQTGFDAVLTTPYDNFLTTVPLEGLVAADFVLVNVTDALPIVITSVTETTPGNYTFVIPSQDVSDVLNLMIDYTQRPGFWLDTNIVVA